MLYFSEIQGRAVYTEDKILVGNLEDMIFRAAEKATITKLVIRNKEKEKLIVPKECIVKINSIIYIQKGFTITELQENELFIMRNLLDKQIIDMVGNKVVRVNDVVIQEKNDLYVAGVDIGTLGIMRRLHLENILLKFHRLMGITMHQKDLSWADVQPLELTKGKVKLKREDRKLQQLRPEDLADYLEKTNIINVKKILGILGDKFSADVIQNLNINFQIQLFKHFSLEKTAKILSIIDSDEAVDILLTFSAKKREEIVNHIQDDKRKNIQYLLSLVKTPIGNIITTEYLTVTPEKTVQEVIEIIKKETTDFDMFYYVYVVNKENQIVGVFNLHELLLQNTGTPIYKFMIQNVVVIHLTTSKELAYKKMVKYRLLALPVIDERKHIIGIITIDDVSEFVLPNLS